MDNDLAADRRGGRRYMVALPVRAEWDDDESGQHVVAEGETENVGPEGALVHLHQLPNVGSRVQLMVRDADGHSLQVITEVLRLERNPVQPLAALQLLDALDEWRGMIWEPAAPQIRTPPPADGEDEDEDEEEMSH